MPEWKTIVLWLLIINLGIAFGAGVYEGRIEFPRWLVSEPGGGYFWDVEAARTANTGIRFWVYVTTVPLTLLTILNLIAAWRVAAPLRNWWLAAGLLTLADRAFTFSYFIPTMAGLTFGEVPQAEAVPTASMWGNLNYIRHTIVFSAWLAALKSLSVLHSTYPRANS